MCHKCLPTRSVTAIEGYAASAGTTLLHYSCISPCQHQQCPPLQSTALRRATGRNCPDSSSTYQVVTVVGCNEGVIVQQGQGCQPLAVLITSTDLHEPWQKQHTATPCANPLTAAHMIPTYLHGLRTTQALCRLTAFMVLSNQGVHIVSQAVTASCKDLVSLTMRPSSLCLGVACHTEAGY